MPRLLVLTILSLACFLSVMSDTAPDIFAGKPLYNPRFGRYIPRPPSEQPLDFLDKVYAVLEDIKCELKTTTEMVDSLEATMSQLTSKLSQIKTNVIPAITITDTTQSQDMQEIEDHLARVIQVKSDLDDCNTAVQAQNDYNIDASHTVLVDLSSLLTKEINQDGDLANLYTLVSNVKNKLLQHFNNSFALFNDGVVDAHTDLRHIRTCEYQRQCETGVVVFGEGETHAEYLFHGKYNYVPFVYYTISCYDAGLDERPDQPPAYGTYTAFEEPNMFGFQVFGNPSLYGVQFTRIDHAFADTVNRKMCLNVLVCSFAGGPKEAPSTPRVPENGDSDGAVAA